MTEALAQEILKYLHGSKLTLLALHRRPDPDSLGSAAALGTFLEAQGWPHLFYCPSAPGPEAHFFGLEARFVVGREEAQNLSCDTVCTFDAGDLPYAGLDAVRWPQMRPFIINFDHHVTNTNFGDLNIVATACASTTEIIYQFFRAVSWPIPARAAKYLLAGLLTDTDHFFNPATSASALRIAGELLSRGAVLSELRHLLFERRPVGALRLIGEALIRLRLNSRYGVAVTYLTEEDTARHGAAFEDIEGVTNILNALGEVKAMLLLKSEGGFIRGSLRTTRKDIDVSRLAELFGGGGHKKAAGFTVRGRLTEESGRVKIV